MKEPNRNTGLRKGVGEPGEWMRLRRGESGRTGALIFWLAVLVVLLGALYSIYSGGKNLQDMDLWSEEGRQDAASIFQKVLSNLPGMGEKSDAESAEAYAREISQRPFTLAELAGRQDFWPSTTRLSEPVKLNDGTLLQAGDTCRVMYISPSFIRVGNGNAWEEVRMNQTDVEEQVREKLYEKALAGKEGNATGSREGATRGKATKPPQSQSDKTVPPIITYVNRQLRANEVAYFHSWNRAKETTYNGKPCWNVRVRISVVERGGSRPESSTRYKNENYNFYMDGNKILGTNWTPDVPLQ